MIARISPSRLRGSVCAIPSKSEAHRSLICAALASSPTVLRMGPGSEDISATIRCLSAFGADIRREDGEVIVHPAMHLPEACEADCGESGSTLRFLLPVAGALGIDTRFHMHGRLPQRPIAPLDRELTHGGCSLSRPEADVLRICGRLRPGAYELPGDVSSQYISGLLFALTLLDGDSTLRITGHVESAAYIDMTLKSMAAFGARPERIPDGYRIRGMGRYLSPGSMTIGGDWSNAAFWLCADALPGCAVCVEGLDNNSAQGDKRVVKEIAALRAAGQEQLTIDAADIPDLVPILAACACARRQSIRVVHAQRLRIKESDRLQSVRDTLNRLGANITETEDGLIVDGSRPLRGGEADACGDHRIAMMAAIASAACTEEVIIHGAEAVNKSYPGFWADFESLGGCVTLKEG